jgi:hypothetical protein
MFKGHPVETRTVAAFAMGIPLLCALAGWWRWRSQAQHDAATLAQISGISNERLAHLQFIADPLADQTISAVVGAPGVAAGGVGKNLAIERISLVNRQFGAWVSNQSLLNWPLDQTGLPAESVAALQAYLHDGHELPAWADPVKIERAEALFMDYGALSCTLLFCSSLPECYVAPDLADVLHISGQLEQHTEHRIRATAAMIFPVMMHGGLLLPNGSGIAQILKVRLIHASIRHLILRGSPASALAALDDKLHLPGAGVIAALANTGQNNTMHEALFAHGWKTGEDGLPCNQEELAYTLLTFGYVFLRSLRTLGLALTPADEEAYLHAWNVVGHVLGIRRELMADTMPQAQALFAQMQARARQTAPSPAAEPRGDVRPALGKALMAAMENAIPFTILKPFPVLMTRYLCGARNAREIGVDGRVSWFAKFLFAVFIGLTRFIDSLVRFFVPEFSIARLITRVLGYHFMSKVLLDQTRPLKLPDHVLNDVKNAMQSWSEDAKAPDWMNTLEDKFTQAGAWTHPSGAARRA